MGEGAGEGASITLTSVNNLAVVLRAQEVYVLFHLVKSFTFVV
jgi:hypothetical protein